MNKKGQAAMEFLMTYGWAILAAIVVIAVLAIYFRPSTLVSGSTFVTAPFYAQGSVISTTAGGVQLEVKNNGGEQLAISDLALTVKTPSSGVACTGGFTNVTGALTLEAGQVVTLQRNCTGLSSGQFSADVAISYTKQGSSLVQKSTGSLAGSVTA